MKPLKGLSPAGKVVLLGIVLAVPGFGVAALAYVTGQTVGLGAVLLLLVILGGLAGGVGLVLFTVGVAVYVFGPAGDPERAAQNYASYATVLGCLYLAVVAANIVTGLYFAAAYLGGQAGAGGAQGGVTGGVASLAGQVRSLTGLLVAALVQGLAFLGVLYVRIMRPGLITWQSMGLDGRRLGRRLGLGLALAVTVIVVMGAISYLLSLLGIRQTQEQLFVPLRHATPLQFALMLGVAALLTGLVEESFFRGYVFASFYHAKGARQAYLASAFIFAAAHVNWQAFLPLFVTGLILAFAYRRSGSIVPAIIAHAINNGVALAIIYLGVA